MTSTSSRFLGYLTILALAAGVGLLTGGCGESESRVASKTVREKLTAASELIQQSRLVSGPAQQDQFTDEQLQQLEQLSRQAAAGQVDVSQAMELTRQHGAALSEYDEAQEQQRQEILARAKTQLQEASAAARRSGDRQMTVAPELMLGSVNLTQGQRAHARLRQLDQEQLGRLTGLASLRDDFANETIRALSVQSADYEEQAAAQLRELLSEGGLDLSREVEQTQAELTVLDVQMEQAQQEYQRHEQQANELRRQMRERLAAAEQANTAEQRLQAGTAAYQIEVGCTDCPQPTEGLLHHEAQAQIAQERIEALESQIVSARLHQEQLQLAIAGIEEQITSLEQAQTPPVVQEASQNAQARRQQLVTAVRERLEEIARRHEQYQQKRIEAVGHLEDARAAFERALGAERRNRAEIQQLTRAATAEMVEIWQQDALHQQTAAATLDAFRGVEGVAESIEPLIEQYLSNARQATASAEELAGQLAQTAQPEQAGPQDQTDPMTGGELTPTDAEPTPFAPPQF